MHTNEHLVVSSYSRLQNVQLPAVSSQRDSWVVWSARYYCMCAGELLKKAGQKYEVCSARSELKRLSQASQHGSGGLAFI